MGFAEIFALKKKGIAGGFGKRVGEAVAEVESGGVATLANLRA